MPYQLLSPKVRGLIKHLAMLGVAIAVLVAVQPFLWALVRDGAHRVWENQSRLGQVAILQQRMAAAQEEQERQWVFFNQLSAVVPGSQNTLNILERLESVAQRVGVRIEVKGIQEGTAGETEQEAPPQQGEDVLLPLVVTVLVSGQPHQLFEYLAGVEHIPELAQVRTLNFIPSQGPLPQFEMTLGVTFYLQRQSDGDDA